ncbi:pescadillo homolog isoform X2 [Papaver somniferum]|uniref:pescadillo homolog isoform X2 n=1 Tax=Papaver somniferum TaxID=3469 RepID=UPI000E6F5B8D|nr:pescadillo homolog isoform X2 [Papaver somniferum]
MPKHYRPPGKKKEGNSAKYSTRTKALRHLQVTLPTFRKLCILKGVFPREPKKKYEGNNKTYYHSKDIAFLQHEPLMEKFRDIRAYDKKIHKAVAKKNDELAKRLRSRKPGYTLDRLVKERYPTFIDALRDLDDCLTMVHLFAALPAVESEHIQVKDIHTCRRLSHEWQAYISRTNKLRKTFISVKGTYYQTLLSFINFRLYQDINVNYPPTLDPRLEALGADQYALSKYIAGSSMVESQAGKVKMTVESELKLAQLQHQLPANEPGALMQLVEGITGEDNDDEETRECKGLFKDLKIFLSREVPRESLLFVIPAFGGIVSWDGEGAPFQETDDGITHQIVDRPTQGHVFLSREYVQPQWIYDCVNARILLPTDGYMVGRVPPPHLSPFVDNEAEGYVPEYAEVVRRLKAEAKKEVLPMPGLENLDLDDPQSLVAEGIMSRTEAIEIAQKKLKMDELEKRYHEELQKELQKLPYSAAASSKKNADSIDEEIKDRVDRSAKDVSDMDQIVRTRKQRGLVKAMEMGIEKKAAKVNLLKKRKENIAKAPASKSS